MIIIGQVEWQLQKCFPEKYNFVLKNSKLIFDSTYGRIPRI